VLHHYELLLQSVDFAPIRFATCVIIRYHASRTGVALLRQKWMHPVTAHGEKDNCSQSNLNALTMKKVEPINASIRFNRNCEMKIQCVILIRIVHHLDLISLQLQSQMMFLCPDS
jgi:hypothetical protein